MLRGTKSTGEVRFELVIVGAVLLVGAVLYVAARAVPGLMFFFPGLILLGGAIYQDLQPGWKAGWLTYVLAIVLVATGLASVVNTMLGDKVPLNWLVVAVVEVGVILIFKAFYAPHPTD
jgi:hypothetical protein